MNDAAHRIRLPKPWNVTANCDTNLTTHEFQRNFQCPSGLDDTSRVELEIQVEDIDGLQQIECSLNEHAIVSVALDARLWRVPISREWLQSINRLTIRLMWLGERPNAVLPQVAILIG